MSSTLDPFIFRLLVTYVRRARPAYLSALPYFYVQFQLVALIACLGFSYKGKVVGDTH